MQFLANEVEDLYVVANCLLGHMRRETLVDAHDLCVVSMKKELLLVSDLLVLVRAAVSDLIHV